jgi:protein-tyrosine phosphatase
MSDTRVIRIPDDATIDEAARTAADACRDGKLVAFPTETVYGIAALATNDETMGRLRDLKDRPTRPFSVHVGSADQALGLVPGMCSEGRRLVRKCWPGPVTIVTEVDGPLPHPAGGRDLAEVLCSDGWIGLRCPDEPVAVAMLERIPEPVVAPSANLAGEPSPRSGREVLAGLDGRIDLLLDHGQTRCGVDSTIVRVAPGRLEMLREGAVGADEVRRCVMRRIVFVCTGNTCRSPMAEGLARKLLAQRLGCRVGELSSRFYEVVSAGVQAGAGQPATPEAVTAARQFGADIAAHRSQPLTGELIQRADMVLCMTGRHLQEARRLAPEEADKIRLLSEQGEVADPIGAGPDVYLETAGQLETMIDRLLDEGNL